YFSDDFIKSYNGIMNLMLQSHTEFQIVTPRTLENFEGEVLIFPDVKCISEEEITYLKSFLAKGKGLLVTGETGNYDNTGARVSENPIHKMLEIEDADQKRSSSGKLNYIYSPKCPGKLYSDLCTYEFNIAAWKGNDESTSFKKFRENFLTEVNNQFSYQSQIIIEASPFLSTQIVTVENKSHVFIANYKGLKSDEIAKQIPEKDVKIKFLNNNEGRVYYLPYLGEKIELDSEITSGNLTCIIPVVDKGGVVWVEN
ncbi:MAG: hypothetical protein WBH40_14885, partial [Ignavibacteriaceae bacterium]